MALRETAAFRNECLILHFNESKLTMNRPEVAPMEIGG